MADVVRDLVVSLSLDAGEFTRNMRAINASIKEAESSFRLAGAGVAKFESSLGGQMAKAEMLMQTQVLQSAAVKQYAAHLSEANSKMVATEGYLAKYSARLAEAKAQMAPLNAEIAKQHAEVERTNAVYASVDAAYQQNINSINSLLQSMVSLEHEIPKPAQKPTCARRKKPPEGGIMSNILDGTRGLERQAVFQRLVTRVAVHKPVFIFELTDCGDVSLSVHDGEFGLCELVDELEALFISEV